MKNLLAMMVLLATTLLSAGGSAGAYCCTPTPPDADGLDELSTRCDATPGPGGAERCNGLDDNCDGTIDEGFPDLFRPCSTGVGACARAGTKVCAADGLSTQCDAIAGPVGEERCNGLDDDCDGAVDDGFDGLGTACTVGDGACRRVPGGGR